MAHNPTNASSTLAPPGSLSYGRRRAFAALCLCALLYGPTRLPIDDVTHWEIRVRLCTRMNEPHVLVETRTYERVAEKGGYIMRPLSQGDEHGWNVEKSIRLYVTTENPDK